MVNPFKLGVIGFSPGNGHPFSFSSIINGFSQDPTHWNDWGVIFNYLKARPKEEIGIPGFQVTHAWTQDPELTTQIARAAKIPNTCQHLKEMIEQIDGVLLARDDWESHLEFAESFLKAGKKIFIDKPLSLSTKDLAFFQPYLESGQLMSCSGFRYCQELDELRETRNESGTLKWVQANVLNDWEKYGIHMLEAIDGVWDLNAQSVLCRKDHGFKSYEVTTAEGPALIINCLGKTAKTFQLNFWGEQSRFQAEINDNFTAFRRSLIQFSEMVKTGQPAIQPKRTIGLMKTLIAGRMSDQENRKVNIDEITI